MFMIEQEYSVFICPMGISKLDWWDLVAVVSGAIANLEWYPCQLGPGQGRAGQLRLQLGLGLGIDNCSGIIKIRNNSVNKIRTYECSIWDLDKC